MSPKENLNLIVHVHADASITLDDPDTFTDFSIRAGSLETNQIVAAFEGDAEAGGDGHVWISIPPIARMPIGVRAAMA